METGQASYLRGVSTKIELGRYAALTQKEEYHGRVGFATRLQANR
jgi:hypothetical protein